MLHPYLYFDGSHINYKIIDRIFRLICLIKYMGTAHSHSASLHVRVALARYTPACMLIRLRVNSHELRACRCALLVETRKKSFPINWKALWYAAEKIRTPDTLVRSQVLYPAELRPHLCCVSQQMIFYRSFDQMSSDFLTKLKPISKSSKSPNITNSKCLRKTGITDHLKSGCRNPDYIPPYSLPPHRQKSNNHPFEA